ncbi:MAG: MBL fold metallo-hydrolase [Hyphomicrobiales bacterium]|nr:MAG: MBL fold metallo-hydrolase [Hyphomicrobiales bacterium]
MQIGDIRIDSLIDGEAVLDPLGLYGGEHPPTEHDWEPYKRFLDPCTGQQINTIGSYLIRFDDRVILQDAGMGPQAGGQEVFACGALRSAMWDIGVSPLDVTDIIYSHLHFDHIGWTTINGRPYFPNAAIHIDKRDWDYYTDPDYVLESWETGIVRSDEDLVQNRFKPVLDRIEFFEGDQEVFPGVRALEASGHTPGHTVLELNSRGEKGLLIGDLVHTQGELVEGWEFYVNHDVPKAVEAIERFRKYIYDNKLPFAAAHFPGMKWGQLVKDEAGRIAYETI